jgi:hypothetical protein
MFMLGIIVDIVRVVWRKLENVERSKFFARVIH